MKKLIVFCATLILILSACAQMPKPIVFTKPEKGVFDAPTGNVSSPDSSSTWTINNITIIYPEVPEESVTNNTEIGIYKLQIDGLKNDSIESKINKLISTKIQELTKYTEFNNLPVSPGFYAKYPKGTSTVKSISISTSENYNCNNLLSLRFFVSVTISDKLPENEYSDFYIEDTMTIDLNTGNEIHLSDLFINGFDFEKALNTAVLLDASSKTDEGEDEYSMSYIYRGGFSVMRSDIGFVLSIYGLNLIFDTTYSEFDNGFSSTMIEIPFAYLKNDWAFGQRFLSKESLYIDSKVNRMDNYLFVSDEAITHYVLNGIPVTSTVTINNQIKGYWLTLAKNYVIEDRNTIEVLSKTNVTSINYELSAQPSGQYIRISRKFFPSKTGYMDQNNIEKTYMVSADGSILTLKDLFKPGFDYETPIKKALAEFLKTEYWPGEAGIPPLDEAYKSLNLVLGYSYFDLFNTAAQPPAVTEGQIDLYFRIDDFKGNINDEVLLK